MIGLTYGIFNLLWGCMSPIAGAFAEQRGYVKTLRAGDTGVGADEFIDGADLAILLANWGSSNPCTDFTGDGVTDGADLAILLASWGVRLEFP